MSTATPPIAIGRLEASAPRPSTGLAPVAPDERVHALDMPRGWALFGVLWSNLNDWYGTAKPVTTLDRALSWSQDYLIDSRFYGLLILLFGIGFGIQLVRATSRSIDVRNTYYRRSAVLLVIGVIHGCLIWNGDILTTYALVSFALVMFRTATNRQIVIAAGLLYFVGQWIVLDLTFLAGLRYPVMSGNWEFVFAHGSWLEIQHARVDYYLLWLGRYGLRSYVTILASFLVGLWTVRSGYLRRVIEIPASTRRLLIVAAIVTAVGYATDAYADVLWPAPQAPAGFQPHFPFPYFQLTILRRAALNVLGWSYIGGAVAYACVLLLLWQRPAGAWLLRPLAATGRMGLTTYLTQSVACTLLFYGYGFGLFGHVGFAGMLGISLVLYGCQMAMSTWWLKRFRFGPTEWLWRKLTYGEVPPMRLAVPNVTFGWRGQREAS